MERNPEQQPKFDFEGPATHIELHIQGQQELCACGEIRGEGNCPACIAIKKSRGEYNNIEPMPKKYKFKPKRKKTTRH